MFFHWSFETQWLDSGRAGTILPELRDPFPARDIRYLLTPPDANINQPGGTAEPTRQPLPPGVWQVAGQVVRCAGQG